jgi:hypothetical protein
MISYPDFEFAIARWKSRAAGVPQLAPAAASGTVAAEVPVATAPEDPAESVSGEATVITGSASIPASGSVVISDELYGNSPPESDPQ